jgi:WD40 repeat protein
MQVMRKTGLMCAVWLLLSAEGLHAQPAGRVDAAGDPLPERAVSRLGSDRFVTRGRVASLAFSVDGSLLAAADHPTIDGSVIAADAYLWDAKTGKRLLHIRNGGGRVAISPDGRWLACGGHLAVSPADGLSLALGDICNPVQIWNVKTKQAVDIRFFAEGIVFGFSPDGKTFAMAFQHKMEVYLFDTATWKLRQNLEGGTAAANCHDLAFSPDGRWLAVAHTANREAVDKLIRPTGVVSLWDLGKQQRREFPASKEGALHVAFTQKGKTLAAMSEGEAQSWDSETGKPIPWTGKFSRAAWLNSVAFDVGGKTLADSLRSILDNLDFGVAGKPYYDSPNGFSGKFGVSRLASPDSTALSGNGKKFAAVPIDGNCPLQVWEVDTRKPVTRGEGHIGPIDAQAFSPDGRRIVTASNYDATFCLWDASTAKLLSTTSFRDASGKMGNSVWGNENLGFNDHGRGLFVAGQLWDLGTEKPQRRLPAGDFAREVANANWGRMSSNGKWAANYFSDPASELALGRGGVLVFWDVAKHQPLFRMKGSLVWAFAHRAPLACVDRYSPDGRHLEVWDFAAGKSLIRVAHPAESTRAVVFSPDDSLLAVFADPAPSETVGGSNFGTSGTERSIPRLNMVQLGSERNLWQQNCDVGGLRRDSCEIAFAPHGQWIAAMSGERSVQVLETWTGEKIMQYEGHLRPIKNLAFSPTARQLATSSGDTTVLLWSAMPPALPLPERWQDDDHLWRELAGSSAAAYRVIGPLIAHPERAFKLFEKRLEPPPSVDAAGIQKDIKNLGSESYPQREAAVQRLRGVGQRVLPALLETLKDPGSLEVKRRLEGIVKDIDPRPSAEELRRLRGILALEMIGTPEALSLLRRLAQGDPGPDSTRHARAAVARLEAQAINRDLLPVFYCFGCLTAA